MPGSGSLEGDSPAAGAPIFGIYGPECREKCGVKTLLCFNCETAGRQVEKLNITFFAPGERERLCQNGLQNCVDFTGAATSVAHHYFWRGARFFALAYNGRADFPDPKRANC